MPEKFEIRFKKSAHKELLSISQPDLKRLVDKVAALALDPHPPDATKLVGVAGFRIRQGDWRVLYDVDEAGKTVTVRKVAHRREVYR